MDKGLKKILELEKQKSLLELNQKNYNEKLYTLSKNNDNLFLENSILNEELSNLNKVRSTLIKFSLNSKKIILKALLKNLIIQLISIFVSTSSYFAYTSFKANFSFIITICASLAITIPFGTLISFREYRNFKRIVKSYNMDNLKEEILEKETDILSINKKISINSLSMDLINLKKEDLTNKLKEIIENISIISEVRQAVILDSYNRERDLEFQLDKAYDIIDEPQDDFQYKKIKK